MIFRKLLVTSLAAVAVAVATGPTFIPDSTFKGSTLTGWHTLGHAEWKASNGEITGRPTSPEGGWLLMDRSLQDLGVYASFRCAAGCKTGIILRAQKTNDGMKGLFVSLTQGDLGLYQVTLDSQGKEMNREKLRNAPSMIRIAPPATPDAGRGGRGGAGRGGRGGFPAREPVYHAGDWNTVQAILDANILHGELNAEATGLGQGVTEDEGNGFGPIGLYVGGTAEVTFKEVGYKDFNVREIPAEHTSSRFREQRLDPYYYSFGVAAADINRDGHPDIVGGPYYYLGPDFTKRREIYEGVTSNPSNQFSNTWLEFAGDFTGDGWPDVITAGAGLPCTLYVNPRGEARRWDSYEILPRSNTEIAVMKDIDGDGKPDLVLGVGGVLSYLHPDPANPTKPWIVQHISGANGVGAHGLGVGDINGDGKPDVVTVEGWYEQPAAGAASGEWTFHPEKFGTRGGAEMAVYDVNGDGHNDVVTSLNAHGFGLAWYEQKRDAAGKISFVEHMIMNDFWTKNAGNVTFTEPHGSTSGDVDGDGIPDFIVGKRYWSHRDSYTDPDPYGPPVLYWYRTVRNKNAPGGAEFVPELIDNWSGAGSQVIALDLNGDGALDIAVSNDRGTFVFWGTKRR